MMCKTHMCVGAAAALAILQPDTVAECLVGVAGGYLGGWVCDVDSANKSEFEDYFEGWEILIPLAIVAGVDWLFNIGIVNYIISHRSYINIVGMVAFIALLALGSQTNHHTFTHSLLGLVLFGISLFLVFPPILPAFVIGMLLHILLDMFGFLDVQLFYPLRFKKSFHLIHAAGKANSVIYFSALALTLMEAIWFIARSIGGQSDFIAAVAQANQTASAFGLNNVQLYLIGANVVAFMIMVINYIRVLHDAINERPANFFDTIHVMLAYVFALFGGSAGLCLGQVLTDVYELRKFGKYHGDTLFHEDEAYWFVLYLASGIAWVLIYMAMGYKWGVDFNRIQEIRILDHLPLVAGYVAINIITFAAFMLTGDGRRKVGKSTFLRFVLILLCATGGALGGFVTIGFTGKKDSIDYYRLGVPLLICTNVVTVVCLMLMGIA